MNFFKDSAFCCLFKSSSKSEIVKGKLSSKFGKERSSKSSGAMFKDLISTLMSTEEPHLEINL